MRLLESWRALLRKQPVVGGSLGHRGEQLAADYLKQRGYKILARGVKTNAGEIDIVARDQQFIVFVEVKTRRTTDPQEPLEAVGLAKQRQLTKLALGYLKRHRQLECAARFDVVGICWPDDATEPQLSHIVNAFEPTGSGQMFS